MASLVEDNGDKASALNRGNNTGSGEIIASTQTQGDMTFLAVTCQPGLVASLEQAVMSRDVGSGSGGGSGKDDGECALMTICCCVCLLVSCLLCCGDD